jgi:NAD+-dependent protein deacetylase sirtuin 4
VDALAAVLSGRRFAVLTGAGISTESGIPDYRGPETRKRARAPIQYNAFLGDAGARQRYWARAAVGWGRVSAARPNAGHRALARLEQAGLVSGVITQNVDGLHQQAGSRRVVELHGALARVCCLGCGDRVGRSHVQDRLGALNPGWSARPAEVAPDGDAELDAATLRGFVVPACERCGGVLKPDVVFFGECVPAETVAAAWQVFEAGEALLVAGSSLAVFSGYRFVLRASQTGRPVALATLGETRGDALAAVKIEAPLGQVLPALAERLTGVAVET